MDKRLEANMRFLCDESRMLTGITVAYGTTTYSEWAQYGRAQEIDRVENGFIPAVRPLIPDTIYDLASLTKLFTAVVTLALVESGQLSLDETVGQIDPRFIHLQNVTVGDVLSFRISLQTPGRIDTAPTREEGLKRLFRRIRLPNACHPRLFRYERDGHQICHRGQDGSQPVRRDSDLDSFACRHARNLRCRAEGASAVDASAIYYEHRIEGERQILRTSPPCGLPHDPKAPAAQRQRARSLRSRRAVFLAKDMVRFAQALLSGELIRRETLCEIGVNRTGFSHGDGTYRQYLGYLCFAKHPLQRLSEVPHWMGARSIGLSGFTGNHLSIDPDAERFVLFLGNRCHGRVSHIVPPEVDGFDCLRFECARRRTYQMERRAHGSILREICVFQRRNAACAD
ncbi:MAG: serine hydrolase [Christensenellales bacterium]